MAEKGDTIIVIYDTMKENRPQENGHFLLIWLTIKKTKEWEAQNFLGN